MNTPHLASDKSPNSPFSSLPSCPRQALCFSSLGSLYLEGALPPAQPAKTWHPSLHDQPKWHCFQGASVSSWPSSQKANFFFCFWFSEPLGAEHTSSCILSVWCFTPLLDVHFSEGRGSMPVISTCYKVFYTKKVQESMTVWGCGNKQDRKERVWWCDHSELGKILPIPEKVSCLSQY